VSEVWKAFMEMTVASYYFATVMPYRFTNKPLVVEKLMFAGLGILIQLALLLDNVWLWALIGLVWTVATGMSFAGLTKWNVRGVIGVCQSAQMFMAGWNMLIAVIGFWRAGM